MATLRQIEVIRAIMVTGTVGGAARLLNVSSPGISRVMKHAEPTLGMKLFSRRHGRYAPSPEARDIFAQVNAVYDKVGDLQYVNLIMDVTFALRHLGVGAARSFGEEVVRKERASRIWPNKSISRLFPDRGLAPITERRA